MKTIIIAATAVLVVTPAHAETYRLIQAAGNNEREVARGLSKTKCMERKRELVIVSTALGAPGSITCLPESVFKD